MWSLYSSLSCTFKLFSAKRNYSTMGAVTREEGVLKLVHPGGYVEIHRKPINAAEVLKKNPRHSITRPDVFKYPWIVVKPESVLNLGRVFYIVPNRTIYHLLKVKGSPYQPPRQNQSPFSGISPIKSYAGMTPKHQEHGKFLQQSPLPSISWAEDSPQKQDNGKRLRKPSQVSCWPEVIVRCKNTRLGLEEDFTTKIRSFNAKDRYLTDSSISAKFPRRENRNIEFEHRRQVPMLKSCLRKEDSASKSNHLRVSFVLPKKDEEPQTIIREFEFPGFFVG